MQLREIIHKRRSYRSLVNVDISDEIVQDLAECASLSASCFNNQPWNYIFIRDEKQLELMQTAMSRGNTWTKGASMIIAVVSKEEDDCSVHGRIYNLFDTGMATAYLMLRAWDLGLVAHTIAGYSESKAKEILNIPDDMQLIALTIVGKHSEVPVGELSEKQLHDERKRPPRKSFSEFCHHNSYKK